MLKKELVRIAMWFALGLFLSTRVGLQQMYAIFLMSLYFLFLIYGSDFLLPRFRRIWKTWFHYQMMSILYRSKATALVCTLFILTGTAILFSVGWLVGIAHCCNRLLLAYQAEKQVPKQ